MTITRMTFDEYRALDAVNWSTLTELRRSPLHYQHRLKDPRQDTPRLALGRASHTAILEPDRFLLDYALWKGKVRRGKKFDAFKDLNEGRTILKEDEYRACIAMKDAVRGHYRAGGLLSIGQAEMAVTWTDPETRIACKGRPDWLGALATTDLKTVADADATWFARTVARLGWHEQLAFYRRGLRANGIDRPFKFVIVEVEPPHDVAAVNVTDDALALGDVRVGELLQRLAECRTAGEWPGRYPEEVELRLPPWAFGEQETDISGLDLLVTASEEM